MNDRPGSFHVNVDVANPGQFFACCGLLELAERVWGEAYACFDRSNFHIETMVAKASLKRLIAYCLCVHFSGLSLDDWPQEEARQGGGGKYIRIAPVRCTTRTAAGRRSHLMLSWWLYHDGEVDQRLKIWTSAQSALGLLRTAHEAAKSAETPENDADLFDRDATCDAGVYEADPRTSWDALSLGYSLEVANQGRAADETIRLVRYPFVNFLAMIGLQRFRPRIDDSGIMSYGVWDQRLPPNLAAAVAACRLPTLQSQTYSFTAASRGGKGYQTFTRATPVGT